MRSFAQVLHPHLRQRPVLLSAVESHSGQARQVASRVASASGGVVWKPELAKRPVACMTRNISSRRARIRSGILARICGGRVMKKQKPEGRGTDHLAGGIFQYMQGTKFR